jgi:capsid protein
LVMEPEFVSQGRGLPSLSSGILDLKEYRTIRNYEKQALKNLSSRAVTIYNEQGGIDTGDEEMFTRASTPSATSTGGGVFVENVQGGGMTEYFRANSGEKVEAFEFNRPNPNVSEFLNEQVLRQVCNSVGLPIELVWNPAQLKGAPTRMILAKAQRKINQRQSCLYKVFVRIINYAIAKAIENGQLPMDKDFLKWSVTYPPKLSVDEGRDVTGELNALKAGTTTYSEIYGKSGFDWKTSIDQRIIEEKYITDKCQESGLDPAMVFQRSPNPMPTPTNENTNKTADASGEEDAEDSMVEENEEGNSNDKE